ncbi:MAG: glycosyltransferase family 2 protein [Methylomonas sp.]|nr:glycosyltransferase family 2 protein [Methylomonas sp.]PPD22406.1 MAG: glycosyl transferase family 2 [Methylomonas sp.]PPD26177.1 MAG: glycosyl transferase family 2 [Methylomonas sp.]PPD37894.1 MAG: glycosyl transferase family 2 [Methylomonas sp.]PPD42102.1 MAG: glycosyl transferase family 2 [Methylomonas sp.]
MISIIVTTYNWPAALDACLNSLQAQTDRDFEIIVADDGSTDDTRQLIARLQQQASMTIKHIHHDDQGFRAATIRNKAVAASQGDYLLFMDGDCIALPHFVARHRQLAQAGFFVPGNRCLLSRAYTQNLLKDRVALHSKSLLFLLGLRCHGHINRWLPLLHIPGQRWRYWQPERWQNAMTCNLGVWKSDFTNVNGFDEHFEGWGYEDSDLVIRLIHNGIQRKEGRFAVPVLHLWHPQNDRSQHDDNYRRLMARLEDRGFIRAEKGLDQYV